MFFIANNSYAKIDIVKKIQKTKKGRKIFLNWKLNNNLTKLQISYVI